MRKTVTMIEYTHSTQSPQRTLKLLTQSHTMCMMQDEGLLYQKIYLQKKLQNENLFEVVISYL